MSSFVASFIDAAGKGHRDMPWRNVAQLPVDSFKPIRELRSQPRARRRNVPIVGRFWVSQVNRLIPVESRLEMMNLLLLDFTLEISAIVAQPFCLSCGPVEHFPDFFVRLRSGDCRVYDVKRAGQVPAHKNWIKFEMTRLACEQAGWTYAVVSELPPVLQANLCFLEGYRTRLLDEPPYRDELLSACGRESRTLAELAESIGPARALVLPSIYRLIWNRELVADLEHHYIDDPLELTAQPTKR